MLSVIRYSQIIGLVVIDSARAAHLGKVQEVWANRSGKISFLSTTQGYFPLEQWAGISPKLISIYGHLVVNPPEKMQRLHQLAVQSAHHESIGWIEDFLFDWYTGEIKAYVLAGNIAEPFGGRAVLIPHDIHEITAEAVILEEDAPNRLRSEAVGLKGFLSEKKHPVRQVVHELSDHLHELIVPSDRPMDVQVKIKTLGEEMLRLGHVDEHSLKEAINFLHDQWESLQHQIHQSSSRAQKAFESAWENLTGKSL